MTGAGLDEAVVRAFEEQRGRLVAVAYQMLGSRTDAEDAVQEAWLRLARQDPRGPAFDPGRGHLAPGDGERRG